MTHGSTSISGSLLLRLLLLVALLVPTTGKCVEPDRPPSGKNVNEVRRVSLRTTIVKPCLSFATGDFAVLLPRAEVEALAAATPERWKTEDERMALIHGNRAADILRSVSNAKTGFGCMQVNQSPESDGDWLVLRQVELGLAAIVELKTHKFIPIVEVRYSGSSSGRFGAGFIFVNDPGSTRSILAMQWWIT